MKIGVRRAKFNQFLLKLNPHINPNNPLILYVFSRMSNISIRRSCSDMLRKQGWMAQRRQPVIIGAEYAQNREQTPDVQVSTELLGSFS